jgi:hypothetical protein
MDATAFLVGVPLGVLGFLLIREAWERIKERRDRRLRPWFYQ